jgi:hypothetical protein
MSVLLASAVDVLHAALMVAWVVGFPFLIWHGWPRLSRAVAWYSLVFVIVSQLSHWVLGECFLTTLSLWLWEGVRAAGNEPQVLFTVRVVNFVAGIRPTERAAVLLWESAIVLGAVGMLFYWHRALCRSSRRKKTHRVFEAHQVPGCARATWVR